MKNSTLTPQQSATARKVLAALEAQLAELDQIGALVAAAHLDTAIHHLRWDLAQN